MLGKYLIKDVKIFSLDNSIILKKIIEGLELKNLKKIEDFEIEKQILNRITKFASIRHILNKNENNQENEDLR